jgi:hypothetical protein
MNASERLIGFSIRIPHGMIGDTWNAKRRRVHLLNPNVANPLSIDDAVWPLPADVDERLRQSGEALGEVDANPLNLMPNIPTEWVKRGLPKGTWNRSCLIAATMTHSDYSSLNKIYAAIVKQSAEELTAAVVTGWLDLGIDLMDQTGISGLTNCGLGEAVDPDERRRLAGKLNDDGLVADERGARAIANMLNTLASEHQPFFPVRLWEAPH